MFGPALYIVRAELLPLSVRAIGGSMAVMTSAITGFLMAKSFLPLTGYFGLEMNFLMYATISMIMALIICYFLPESRGKSFDEVQKQMEAGIVVKGPINSV